MSLAIPQQDALTENFRYYWRESRRPLASLLFIIPLLVGYEVGVVALGVQNGADVWMRQLLNWLGFSQHFLLPMLTVGGLLAWHYVTREPWHVSRCVLWAMGVECVAMAILLWIVYCAESALFHSVRQPITSSLSDKFREAVGFLGAGIYEELLFRMLGLSLVMWVLRGLGLSAAGGMAAAALLTSLAFAVAHYVGTYGDAFYWSSFTFRFTAGVFFSVLFACRGFGIVAGAHAAYNILVGLVLASF